MHDYMTSWHVNNIVVKTHRRSSGPFIVLPPMQF